MFKEAGLSYVYLIYGIHYCFNIVVDKSGIGSAVLIRGIVAKDLSSKEIIVLNGPGKLTKFFGIDKNFNNINLIGDNKYLFDINLDVKYDKTKRIGINKSIDFLWRFIIKPSEIPNIKKASIF